MTETPTPVAGRPVTGEINRYNSDNNLPPQKELEDGFIQLLDEMFAAGATHVRWEQYTPYFNDGDPCNFSTGEWYVKTADTPEDAGDYGYGFEDNYDLQQRVGEDHPLVKVLQKLTYRGEFNTKEYYLALNKAFGDPAQVTATPEGFNIEYYDHE